MPRPDRHPSIRAERENLAPPEFDIFERYWKAEVRRSYAFRRALEKAERFISGFEGDELQDGVDDLLAEIRDTLLTGEPASEPRQSLLRDLALLALIPATLALMAGLIWTHLQ